MRGGLGVERRRQSGDKVAGIGAEATAGVTADNASKADPNSARILHLCDFA